MLPGVQGTVRLCKGTLEDLEWVGSRTMWFPTPGQAVAGFRAAQEVYKAVGKDLVTEAFDAAVHGMPTFLLFGPGGNGKSTLKEYLTTLSDDNLDPNYAMSPVWEHDGKLKGRRFSNVTAFPGQPAYRDPQIDDHRKWMRKVRRPFVVLCLSYGYRSVDARQAATRHAPQANQAARLEELEYARGVLNKIHDVCGFPRYKIFSMILKQDLWWDDRVQVDQFYEDDYTKVINEFAENSVAETIFSTF